MPTGTELLQFRQRVTSYVLRTNGGDVEVLVILHLDFPEAGVQVPGGGALPHETIGEAALREASEETGATGLAFGEVLGSTLKRTPDARERRQVDTYSRLSTSEPRDAWEHLVSSRDGDDGLRFRCEFRPVAAAGIDWGLDCYLDRAVERFTAAPAEGGIPGRIGGAHP
ncbi:NUDIX domain-containing protein [Glycomyces xiaoerkulensis]|uniref:NUDIX domain-containing protein n=1 Tax=Glycomyces xiaoerkulensis TaxID=2038139 RepID=UPI000C259D80|nr:NUDIX domain-containing protein [Glycomyces xiaoerkulensis]